MGQTNAERVDYRFIRLITSAQADDIQNVDDTSGFLRGDLVNLVLVDANDPECIVSSVAINLTVSGFCPEDHIVLDQVVDTTSPPAGTLFAIESRSLWDVQAAITRILTTFSEPTDYPYPVAPTILSQELDTPVIGQARYTISGDAFCFQAGDTYQIICADNGIVAEGAIISRDIGNETVTVDASVDLTGLTCCIVNTSLTLSEIISRLKNAVGAVQVYGEDMGVGDCHQTVWELSNIFIEGTTRLYLDGRRLKRGTCGTLASLVNDTGNAELTFTSLVLGTKGNDINIEMLDPAGPSSPLSVTVTGNYAAGWTISVSLETDGGSTIISTAQEVAEAILADAEAKYLVKVIYGGDGTGVQSALTSTPLAGGLDDGTGDYCEIERVLDNDDTGSGFKFVSLWILPDVRNRLRVAPREDEELEVDYSKAS